MMKRREFITLLGGAAVAWPFAAHAQQTDRVRRIGVLVGGRGTDPVSRSQSAALLQGLQQLGWTDGRNIRIDYRWGGGNADDIRKYSAELGSLAPDVILVAGTAAVGPLLQAAPTVPIVFVNLPDPVGAGYVKSLARPGGNVTGFTNFEYGLSVKWLERLFTLTDNLLEVQTRQLEHGAIVDLFERRFSADCVKHHKPSREAYGYVERERGPRRRVFV